MSRAFSANEMRTIPGALPQATDDAAPLALNTAPRSQVAYVFSEVFDLKPTRTRANKGFEQEVTEGTEGRTCLRSRNGDLRIADQTKAVFLNHSIPSPKTRHICHGFLLSKTVSANGAISQQVGNLRYKTAQR